MWHPKCIIMMHGVGFPYHSLLWWLLLHHHLLYMEGQCFFINDEETIPDVEKSPTPSHAIHYMELKCKVVLLGS